VESAAIPVSEAPPAKASGLRDGLGEVGELTQFYWHAFRALFGTMQYASEILRQAAYVIRGSSFLMFAMTGFCGMSAVNFIYFFLRSIGASDYMGVTIGYVGPRQIATTLFGYVFTAKVCCGIAAELGAMKINQEIDAYDSVGVDPYRYVVGTRIMAVLVFAPIATALCLIGVLAGAYLEGVVLLHGIAPHVFLDVTWAVQTPYDQVFCLITITTMSLVTAATACFYGLRAKGGPAGVGTVVARSTLVNLILVHVIAGCAAVLAYGTDIRLPIGG
jgi:phospholipid/cholesterol/gamma-HCH transport system permease protein